MNELTEDQKFMICKAAGVEMTIVQRKDGSLHEITARPCGVIWDGWQYKVYVQAKAIA